MRAGCTADSLLSWFCDPRGRRGQRPLLHCWLWAHSGHCWLTKRCTIMGNKDNICPQSQERTNILPTSKSSLIWQEGRSLVLSGTCISWQGAAWRIYLYQLDLPEPGTMPIADRSHGRFNMSVFMQALPLFPLSPSNHWCPLLVPCSFPEIRTDGLEKVGDFCDYFGGDKARVWEGGGFLWTFWGWWGLALLLGLFHFTNPPPLAQKWQ